jgi:protein-S-isoprenylcysteine O-methyltransferase Ste14
MSLKREPWIFRILTLLLIAEVGWAASRAASQLGSGDLTVPLWLFSESVLVFFVIIRNPFKDISKRPLDWVATLLATYGFLMVTPTNVTLLPEAAGWFIVIAYLGGTLVQIGAKLSLGRSFGLIPANRGVKTRGLYALIRHPMYSGYLLGHLCFLSMNLSWYNAVIFSLVWTSMFYRMKAEERVLLRDPAYQDYAQRVRFRLIPRLI